MSEHACNTDLAKTDFAPCEVCGKKNDTPGHDCDGGEALRKAAHELFAPTVHLIERTIAKAGTGILRGVFEVAFERDALKAEREKLVAALTLARAALYEHGDERYTAPVIEQVEAALSKDRP